MCAYVPRQSSGLHDRAQLSADYRPTKNCMCALGHSYTSQHQVVTTKIISFFLLLLLLLCKYESVCFVFFCLLFIAFVLSLYLTNKLLI
jgi:hypothetical protein